MDTPTHALQQELERLRQENARLTRQIRQQDQTLSQSDYAHLELEAIFRAFPDLLFLLDAEDRFLDYKAGSHTHLFVPPEQFLGKKNTEVLPSASVRSLRSGIAEARATQECVTVTYLLPLPEGMKEFKARIVPLPDGFVVCHVSDITAPHERERERAYILQAARCLLWYADIYETHERYLDWTICFADEEAASRFLPIDVPPGQTFTDAFYWARLEEDRDGCDVHGTAAVRDGRSYQQEYRCRLADGSIRWLQEAVQIETITAGQHWRAVGVCMDITERREAEAALKRSRRQYQELIESVDGIVWEADARSRDFTFVSQKAERLLGYPMEDWYTPNFWSDHLHPEDRAQAVRQRLQSIKNLQSHQFEYRMLDRQGHTVWIRDLVTLVVEEGHLVALRGLMVDITRQKRAEEHLLHIQKMESIGRLAGGIAHDFNNLLTAMLGYAELAEDEVPPNGELATYLSNIRRAGERAADLTAQLLAFARKQIIMPRVVDLNLLLQETGSILERLIGENIELETRCAADLWSVRGDPSQLQQVLLNLAVNARDAMPEGGKLTIETANISFDQALTWRHAEVTPGDYVMLAISDTGEGMTEAVQARIFEPFFTTKQLGKGTGMGLSTCYGIVKQNGGHIWLYSEPGMGTVFKVYLTRIEDTEAAPLPQIEPSPRPRGQETILLVEDEAMVRSYVLDTLVAQGYRVLEATNGARAMQIAADYAGAIHLLITDVVMPVMGGRPLAKRLLEARPDCKVLFLSGYMDSTHAVADAQEPPHAFLQKPFSTLSLCRKVRAVLEAP